MKNILTLESLIQLVIITIISLFVMRLYKQVERLFLSFLKKIFNISTQKRIKLKWEYARGIVENTKSEYLMIDLKIGTLAYFVFVSNVLIGMSIYVLITYTNTDAYLDSFMDIGTTPSATVRENIEQTKRFFPFFLFISMLALWELGNKYYLSKKHFQKKLKRKQKRLRKIKNQKSK